MWESRTAKAMSTMPSSTALGARRDSIWRTLMPKAGSRCCTRAMARGRKAIDTEVTLPTSQLPIWLRAKASMVAQALA